MLDIILDPASWTLQPLNEQAKKSDASKKGKKSQMWINAQTQLSPVQFYLYLKMRFGQPNGLVMMFKNNTTDNLIHWQYAFKSGEAVINVWGKTTGIEMSVMGETIKKINESDWKIMVSKLLIEFKKYVKEIKELKSDLEHWSLFINPFSRIERTVQDYMYQLEKLNLEEPFRYSSSSKKEFDAYKKQLDRWTKNISKAASLGTSIRMHCPVMAESFINLVILVFRNEELAKDKRLYDNFLRQAIDIRVKTLHMNCNCFPKQIDDSSDSFKNFHTMMNNRNDVLHGNIVPKLLQAEDVWFDQRTIPLFEKDEGIIVKMLRNYCTNVEREKALNDFQVVSNLIELVLMSMDDDSMRIFMQIMGDRMPGYNNKTGRLGALFTQGPLVESFIGYK
jgi:hypothetical protein